MKVSVLKEEKQEQVLSKTAEDLDVGDFVGEMEDGWLVLNTDFYGNLIQITYAVIDGRSLEFSHFGVVHHKPGKVLKKVRRLGVDVTLLIKQKY